MIIWATLTFLQCHGLEYIMHVQFYTVYIIYYIEVPNSLQNAVFMGSGPASRMLNLLADEQS